MKKTNPLEDKIAIVTGGGAGIGYAVASEFAKEELRFARYIDKNVPSTGKELSAISRNVGCGDIFPEHTEEELKWIKEDGKIPKHSRWADRIAKGEFAVDTLLSLAGLATFAQDQQNLDQRIRSLIS